jgi:hypothetical protein
VTDFAYTQVLVYDNLGGAVRLAANTRVNITNPTTGVADSGLKQGGQSVTYVTSDSTGHATFTSTLMTARLTTPRGFWMDVTSSDAIAAAAALQAVTGTVAVNAALNILARMDTLEAAQAVTAALASRVADLEAQVALLLLSGSGGGSGSVTVTDDGAGNLSTTSTDVSDPGTGVLSTLSPDVSDPGTGVLSAA